mgnify:CR=1 FL=1
MGAIFQSLGRTVIAGIVILAVMLGAAGTFGKMGDHAWAGFFMRYLHVLSGVMWIGLLWYFNFVQMPSMPKIPDEQKPAVGKVIAPAALFWFRWAALATTGMLTAVFAWRATVSWAAFSDGQPEKWVAATIISVMGLASLFMLALLSGSCALRGSQKAVTS